MRTRAPGVGGRAHDAVGDGGAEELRVIARREREDRRPAPPRSRRARSASATPSSPANAAGATPSWLSAAMTSRCRAAMSLNGRRMAAASDERFQRRERSREACNQVGGGIELALGRALARIAAVQVARVRCRNVASACARPAVPGFGRGPRSTARSSAAIARAWASSRMPSRSSGCLSSASSVTGARPPSGASAASRANTPAGVSASASPPESSTATFQRPSAATTRRASAAVGRDQRGVLAGRLDRLAQRDRDRQRLLLGIAGFDHRDARERGA